MIYHTPISQRTKYISRWKTRIKTLPARGVVDVRPLFVRPGDFKGEARLHRHHLKRDDAGIIADTRADVPR